MHSTSETHEEWLAAVEVYIDHCRDLRSVLRADELAQRLHLSPVQLERAFHAAVGVSVGGYLKQRQIEMAKALLSTTALTTAAIAGCAGFGTARSFFRAFLRATGMTPTAFRRERNVTGEAPARPPTLTTSVNAEST